MRTTLAIDDDILLAAKSLARQQRKTVGEVVSELARKSLRQRSEGGVRSGVPLLPISNPEAIVTPDLVNALLDELP